MADLAGKVVFLSGASRGIGLAIGLRAARDGARVVVAAKTAEPHPKLPGTIFTAADEIRAAGGEALPLQVDIRFEDQVEAAVAKVVETWGGIDILVNNASAISLTGTLATEMKRYDLMHGINARGTFLTTQKCLPHLLKAANPHVLTISPPLAIEERWFAPHAAYTLAKYGMSLLTLGWAGEFRQQGVAFNCLWPRTTIATAATHMLGGEALTRRCRLPAIMGDAAHAILVRPSRESSGNFLVDEAVLREGGRTDFSEYLPPGTREEDLAPDYFL